MQPRTRRIFSTSRTASSTAMGKANMAVNLRAKSRPGTQKLRPHSILRSNIFLAMVCQLKDVLNTWKTKFLRRSSKFQLSMWLWKKLWKSRKFRLWRESAKSRKFQLKSAFKTLSAENYHSRVHYWSPEGPDCVLKDDNFKDDEKLNEIFYN